MMKPLLVFFLFGLLVWAGEHETVTHENPHFPVGEAEGGNRGYRQAFMAVPVIGLWNSEANMYYTEDDAVMFAGASRAVSLGRHIRLHPGAGILFGQGENPGPAIKLRASVETRRWISEFSGIQGLRRPLEASRCDRYVEGHLSRKFNIGSRKFEAGIPMEDIIHGEGKENLIGVRGLISLTRHISVTGKVMTHHTYRLGIIFHPQAAEE